MDARELVASRDEDYGDPAENMERTAGLWSAILGGPVSPREVVLCLMAVKLSRLAHRTTLDSCRDLAGYAHILDLLDGGDGA